MKGTNSTSANTFIQTQVWSHPKAIRYRHQSNTGVGDGVGVENISIWSDLSMPIYGEVLHTEGEFTLRKRTGDPHVGSDKFQSIIQHECSAGEVGKRNSRKVWRGTWSAAETEVCQRCRVKIPEGLLTLWKLHNWDALQKWFGEEYGKG